MKRLALSIVIASIALVACSASKPSAKEAERATLAMFKELGFSYVDDFTIDGCVEARVGDGVNCDVSGTFVMEDMGRRFPMEVARNLRFSKASGEWRAFAQ